MTTKFPLAGDDLDEYMRQVLAGLGYQPTPWRLEYMATWASFENTEAQWNPLATTRLVADDEYGKPPHFNSNGGNPVKNYRDEAVGVRATVETLELSSYPAIRASLADQSLKGRRKAVAAQTRTWGTMGMANRVANGWTPGGSTAMQAEEPQNRPQRPHVGAHATKAARDAAMVGSAGIVAAAVAGIAGDFPWEEAQTMWQAHHWYALIALATPFVYRLIAALTKKES